MKHLPLILIACALLPLDPSPAAASAPAAPGQRLPGLDCPWVVRVAFADRAELVELAGWAEPWEVDRERGIVVLGVDQNGLDRLRREGFPTAVDEGLTRRACQPPPPAKDGEPGIPGFNCYSTVEEAFARAEAIVTAHPNLAEWVDIGDSWARTEDPTGGYDLRVLKLTNQGTEGTGTAADPASKPRLFAIASIHAREYAPAELLTRFGERLVADYGHDADTTWLLDEHEIHLLLLANPDGRKHAEEGVLWRKNVDNEFCSDTDMRGIDLNRNFDYQWGCCGGSSPDECSEIFRGPEAASEPEAQAIQAYLRAIFPDQWQPTPPADATGVYLDVHSYGRLLLWPWGFTDEVPPNGTRLATLGRKLAFFNFYRPEQGIDFYPTDGTTPDFAYGDRGVAAFTIELGTWFFEYCDHFETMILEDNLALLMYAAKAARTPYLSSAGPDVTSVAVLPGAVVSPGSVVELRAVVDDTRYRFNWPSEPVQFIAAAEVTVDVPPWADPPTVLPMLAMDGSLDESLEELRVELDTAPLEPGRHTLFVRGRDADGNWGVVTAAFLWVGEYPDGGVRSGGGRLGP